MTDFAFLDGTLAVTHGPSGETGTIVARPVLGGIANVAEVRVGDRLDGLSLKVRDPATGVWSVWWVSAATGQLELPLRGRWSDGRIRLAGVDPDGSLVVYAIAHGGQAVARSTSAVAWTQSRSTDGGETWVVDRTMEMTRTGPAVPPPPAGDFGFLARSFAVAHRRRSRSGGDGWETFSSRHQGTTYLGGAVSVDEVGLPGGASGMTFRVRDAATGVWSIWWVNSVAGQLEPPVRGGFDPDGVGRFVGAEGTTLVRFTWSDVATPTPRWTQELSTDGGRTWALDWEMAFS